MPMTRVWHGETIRRKGHRAAGRGIVGIAVAISRETKIVTDKISGTLARSVHAAPARYEGAEQDETDAAGGQDLGSRIPLATPTGLGPACEVGSWVSYACVEWVGRGHPGVQQGLEKVRGPQANAIMAQAWREEGMLL